MRLLGRFLMAGKGERTKEPTANAAASILFNSNPAAFPDFAAGLNDATKRPAMAHLLAGTTTPAASASAVGLANALDARGAAR